MVDTFLFVNIALTLIQIAIIIVFYVQSRKFDRNSEYLLLAISFGIVASIVSVIEQFSLPKILGGLNVFDLLLALQLILYSFEYLFVFIHFEYGYHEAIRWKTTGVFFFFQGILVANSIDYVFNPLSTFQEFIWDFSYNALGILAFGFAGYYLYLSYKFTGERLALIQATGTLLLVLGFVIGLLQTPKIRTALHFSTSLIIGDVIKVLGALIFISIYAYNPDFVERIIIETYGVLVFDQSGRELAYLNVQSKKKEERMLFGVDPTLLSSLIGALLAFLKEALKSQEYPQVISAEDKEVMFESGERIGVALITDSETTLMRRSLKKFVEDCESNLPDKEYLDPFDEEWVSNVLLEKFPYLVRAEHK